MKKGNIILSVICAILGITVIAIASGYPTAADYGTGVPGPGLWPIVISVAILICAALLMQRSLRMKGEDDTEIALWTPGTKRVYITMIILVIYAILLEPLGFLLATTAIQFVFIQWFAKKKWYITLIISAVVSVVVYLAFNYLLNVPLDFGLLAF